MEYKIKKSYKTISEVVKILNDNSIDKNNHSYTLRYWETQFKQIKPRKINNRRYYDTNNINVLLKIQYLLKNQGMTINGVKKFLNKNILSVDGKEKKNITSLNIKYRLDRINSLVKKLKLK